MDAASLGFLVHLRTPFQGCSDYLKFVHFHGCLNDLLSPIIYLSSPDKMTLTVGLTYFKGQYSTDWHLLMAGAVVSIVPTILVYLFAQKHFAGYHGWFREGVEGGH